MKLVPRRYPLTDHLPPGRTSAVGANHSPVSPKKVVVAGRVSAVAVDEDGVWLPCVLCPADVPEDPDCALALPVRASSHTKATATRLAISRLQSVYSVESVTPHGSLHSQCPLRGPLSVPPVRRG